MLKKKQKNFNVKNKEKKKKLLQSYTPWYDSQSVKNNFWMCRLFIQKQKDAKDECVVYIGSSAKLFTELTLLHH